jgi:uncharacterized membrane protein YvlD (DUF360 family)
MVSGMEGEDGAAAVISALVLGFVNAFILSILVLLTLPIHHTRRRCATHAPS